MTTIGFIPARYASTRFPGKPLVNICGKPMIQWVYEHACNAKRITRVVVLTDDKRIYNAVQLFGGEVAYTSKKCVSGTERIASILDTYPCDIAVNIQGDEPLLCAHDMDAVACALTKQSDAHIATLARVIKEKERIHNPNIVKVVVDVQDRALYFSRATIPFVREKGTPVKYLQHIGLYAYRTKVLHAMHSLRHRNLEHIEKLEQLRFIENGYGIKVVYTNADVIGVDTPKDVREVEKQLKKQGVKQCQHSHK